MDGAVDSGVPHGAMLLAFTDAVLSGERDGLNQVRAQIYETLGPAALVDAAGAVASFNAVVKVADGTGLTVDQPRRTTAAAISRELGIAHES